MRGRGFRIRSYVIAIFVIVGLLAVAGWWRKWVHGTSSIMAIVTVHQLSLGDDGTVRMRYHVTMKGSPIVFRLGKRSANSVAVYEEDRNNPSITDVVSGRPFGHDVKGEGSFQLGKCPRLEISDTPRRIELKPGESYTLATCTEANGERVELFVSCE